MPLVLPASSSPRRPSSSAETSTKQSDKNNPASWRDYLFLFVVIVECGTYSGTVLRILRNVEADVVELLQGRENLLALGQQREVADEYEVADITAL